MATATTSSRYEFATALAYTFLGTTPTDDLLAAAGRGELANAPASRRGRARCSPIRARAHRSASSPLQWTGAKNVLTVDKRADLFPDFDDATRAVAAAETRAFAAHVAFAGDGTYDALMTANYTVLDATAAKFYGLSRHRPRSPTTARAPASSVARRRPRHDRALRPDLAVQRGLLVRRNFLCEELRRRRRSPVGTRRN